MKRPWFRLPATHTTHSFALSVRSIPVPCPQVELALTDLRAAASFVKGPNAWQVHFHTALLLEANDDLPGALAAVNAAFRLVYVDDVLQAKHRIERALGGQAAGLQKHRVLLKPSYWCAIGVAGGFMYARLHA